MGVTGDEGVRSVNTLTKPEPIAVDRLVSQLKAVVHGFRGDLSSEVSGVQYDSRNVEPGDLFCCIHGMKSDGHDFASQAAEAGASALLVERWVEAGSATRIPQIRVADGRLAMAEAACAYYGNPSMRMRVAGITGTNGKTSTAFMAESIFRAAGYETALVGTVETRIAGAVEPAGRTTPESPDLQHLFWRMAESGVEAVAIEVSSHALELERTAGTQFAVAAFTNLTQDHLDFHASLEDYYRSKRKLFETGLVGPAVINADDTWSSRVPTELPGLDAIYYSTSAEQDASIFADGIEFGPGSVDFHIDGAAGRHHVSLAIPALFAVSNALAAAAVAVGLGIGGDAIAEGLTGVSTIPGRFELVRRGQPFLAVVDYAHTPDAVSAVLASARAQVGEGGRLIVLLGCGGDRDRSKRPLMAVAAVSGADLAILTSDNPRSEEPGRIVDDMISGLSETQRKSTQVELDRRKAISMSLAEARAGDVVVFAGKGHEAGQTAGSKTIEFDDRVVVAEELESLGYVEDVH